jgi:hypothetical protein
MTETSPSRPAFAFLMGVVVASAFWLIFNTINARKLSQGDHTTLQSLQQMLSQSQREKSDLMNANQNLTARANACEARFVRGTFIYDIGPFNGENRAWYIPADIDPVAIGAKRGSYSHFDPKAQTETVHLQPKTQ